MKVKLSIIHVLAPLHFPCLAGCKYFTGFRGRDGLAETCGSLTLPQRLPTTPGQERGPLTGGVEKLYRAGLAISGGDMEIPCPLGIHMPSADWLLAIVGPEERWQGHSCLEPAWKLSPTPPSSLPPTSVGLPPLPGRSTSSPALLQALTISSLDNQTSHLVTKLSPKNHSETEIRPCQSLI